MPTAFQDIPLDNSMILKIFVFPLEKVYMSFLSGPGSRSYDLQFNKSIYSQIILKTAHPNVKSHNIVKDACSLEDLIGTKFPAQPKFERKKIVHFSIELDCGSIDIWAENFSCNLTWEA